MLHSLVYIKNMHEPYKPIKFHPRKIYSEKRNWRATRIYNTQFHWIGRGHRGHAYLIENKRTSQGGPTGDERENRWESLVGYRRCVLIYNIYHRLLFTNTTLWSTDLFQIWRHGMRKWRSFQHLQWWKSCDRDLLRKCVYCVAHCLGELPHSANNWRI